MKEIKFRYRVQHPDGQVFTDFYTIQELECFQGLCQPSKEHDGFKILSRDEHIGVEDDDGADIYNGDILRHPPDRWQLYVVDWDGGNFYLKPVLWSFMASVRDRDLRGSMAMAHKSKVIGNLRENPELLEQLHKQWDEIVEETS